MSKNTTEIMNKDIISFKSDILYPDFRSFFNSLNYQFNTYHAKYIVKDYSIIDELQLSIHNYSEYIDLFEALVENKLYIHTSEGFNRAKMFYDYILPTSVFLHYMHVNISKMSEINLYIIDHKLYSLYRNDVGGEYTTSEYNDTKLMNHVIFVKDYSDYNDYNEARSMISLFHELTHLVDNSDFNGLQQDKIISYELRSTEIKARVYSEFFYAFYSCLCKYISSEDRYNLIHEYNKMLKENLNGLYDTIFNMHESNHALIDTTIQFRTVNDNTMRLTLDNIQYANSLKQIYTLNKFLNQIEDKL